VKRKGHHSGMQRRTSGLTHSPCTTQVSQPSSSVALLMVAVIVCAIGAATQGWDQTGSNGASEFTISIYSSLTRTSRPIIFNFLSYAVRFSPVYLLASFCPRHACSFDRNLIPRRSFLSSRIRHRQSRRNPRRQPRRMDRRIRQCRPIHLFCTLVSDP
jgi:hypothetical protein